MEYETLTTKRLADGTLIVVIRGRWQTGRPLPSPPAVDTLLTEADTQRIQFDCLGLDRWDSSLAVFLSTLMDRCLSLGIDVDVNSLPAGVRRLLSLAESAPRKEAAEPTPDGHALLTWLSETVRAVARQATQTLAFTGELGLSLTRLARGKARYRSEDLLITAQDCGWQALPIVSLISILVGLILAFMGAVQLKLFGAQIYVADLVGIGMAREMGAVMTGVIMAGRTGAAFAANLGTMQVNEEIDALQTLGLSPMDYLVLPRMAALIVMMPLLCIYANVMGILGGMLVGVGAFDISMIQYLNQTRNALSITHFGIGIAKSIVFGMIVAFCGCMQGLNCGRSAAAVGKATTSAVVMSIVYIVVADGIFAVLANVLGI
jgi:phospholipid/cholesterol/gamma-HCH transport system permease protein